tara:strand:- start:139 stop:597 length:459 start_codon:yes stop_codon:yes gene_type:complete
VENYTDTMFEQTQLLCEDLDAIGLGYLRSSAFNMHKSVKYYRLFSAVIVALREARESIKAMSDSPNYFESQMQAAGVLDPDEQKAIEDDLADGMIGRAESLEAFAHQIVLDEARDNITAIREVSAALWDVGENLKTMDGDSSTDIPGPEFAA